MTASCSWLLRSQNELRIVLTDFISGLSPNLTIASTNDEAVPSCTLLALKEKKDISDIQQKSK